MNRRQCRGELWYDIDDKLIYPTENAKDPIGPYTFENVTSSLWGTFFRSTLEPFDYPTIDTAYMVLDRLKKVLYGKFPTLKLEVAEVKSHTFFGTNPSHAQRLIRMTRLKTEDFNPGGFVFQAYRDGWDGVIPGVEAEIRLAGL